MVGAPAFLNGQDVSGKSSERKAKWMEQLTLVEKGEGHVSDSFFKFQELGPGHL